MALSNFDRFNLIIVSKTCEHKTVTIYQRLLDSYYLSKIIFVEI